MVSVSFQIRLLFVGGDGLTLDASCQREHA